MPHMDEGLLQAWLDGVRGGLTEEERREVEAHLKGCERCSALLDELRAADHATRDLLGAVAAAEETTPDFSEVVARAGALREAHAEPKAGRRFPLPWAASIVLAVGVGWMANEVARTDSGVSLPPSSPSFVPSPTDALVGPDAPAESVEPPTALETEAPPTEAVPEVTRTEPEPVAAAERLADGVAPPPLRADSIRRAREAPTWLSGRITDPAGRPLEEAVVTIPGTDLSALSGADGRFRVQVPADGLGADARLRAFLVGYGVETRDIPVGTGELSVDDVRMQPRAVQLEGVVVNATGVAAQRRALAPTSEPSRDLPLDSSTDAPEGWIRVSVEQAANALGLRPLRLPGMEWAEIRSRTTGEAEVFRLAQPTRDGGTILLYQSRGTIDLPEPDSLPRAIRTTAEGLNLVAVGPVDREELVALLSGALPIG